MYETSELLDAVSKNRLETVASLISDGSMITKAIVEKSQSDDVSLFISYFLGRCISAAREIFESLSVEIQPYLDSQVPPSFIFRQALIVSNGPAVLAVHDMLEEDLRERIIATVPDGLAIYDNILNPVSEELVDLDEFSKRLKEALVSEDIALCQNLPHFSAHDVFSFRHNFKISDPIGVAIMRKKVSHLSILKEKGLLFPFPPEVLEQDFSQDKLNILSFLFIAGFPGEPVVFDTTNFSVAVLLEQRVQNVMTAWQTGAADPPFLEGFTMLMITAYCGLVETCQYLLASGDDVNATASDNTTPLHIAVQKGHLDVCKVLIEAGADISAATEHGEQPLHFAALSGAVDVCEYLLSCGADVNCVNSENATPILFAAQEGHLGICKVLIEAGADISIQDTEGHQPLHLCASKGVPEFSVPGCSSDPDLQKFVEICKVLIAAEADVSIVDGKGYQLLHAAAYGGMLELCCLLLQHGADVNCISLQNQTALLLAAERGHFEVCRLLIVRGADCSLLDDNINSFFESVPNIRQVEFFFVLLNLGVISPMDLLFSLESRIHSGVLQFCVEFLHDVNSSLTTIDVVHFISADVPAGFLLRQALLVSNASVVLQVNEHVDPDLLDDLLRTVPDGLATYENIVPPNIARFEVNLATVLKALENALDTGEVKMLQSLPILSADLVFTCRHHHCINKLVSEAIHRRNVPLLSILKEKKFLFPFPAEILHLDISSREISTIQFLLCTGFRGEPVLFSRDSEDIERLLGRRLQNALDAWKFGIADVNFQDSSGWTPLMFACLFNLVDVCSALIEHGADVSLTNNQGEAPLHVASKVGSMELCEFLMKQGRDLNKHN